MIQRQYRFHIHMADYFCLPALHWWVIIPSALGVNFLAFYSPTISQQLIPVFGPMVYYIGTNHHWITVITNIFALFAHIGESLYALYLCRKMNFSAICSMKWSAQTFVLGFPSLRILMDFVKKNS